MTDLLPPPKSHDAPPCTCLAAPVLGDVTVVVLRDPFCPKDPAHREEALLDYEPEY